MKVRNFRGGRGFLVAAWKTQLHAVMAIDRNYRNFAWLGVSMLRDIARAQRQALTARVKS